MCQELGLPILRYFKINRSAKHTIYTDLLTVLSKSPGKVNETLFLATSALCVEPELSFSRELKHRRH